MESQLVLSLNFLIDFNLYSGCSSETLKCLVCKSLVEELEAAIAKVDPRKKIETGSFRLDGAGSQTRTLVSLHLYSTVRIFRFSWGFSKLFLLGFWKTLTFYQHWTNIFQVPYARSQQHLMDLVDSVCKNFEDYAQAKSKSSGEPLIIR